MKYSKEEIITAAEQEVECWKAAGEKKRTDWDYEKLGFVHSVVNRLETNSQNSGKPLVMGWQEFEKQKPNDKQFCIIYNPSGWAHEQKKMVVDQYHAKYGTFNMGYADYWMPLPACP